MKAVRTEVGKRAREEHTQGGNGGGRTAGPGSPQAWVCGACWSLRGSGRSGPPTTEEGKAQLTTPPTLGPSDRQSLLKSGGNDREEERSLPASAPQNEHRALVHYRREGTRAEESSSSPEAGTQVLLSLGVRQDNRDRQEPPKETFPPDPQISGSLWRTECAQSHSRAQTPATTD